MKTVRKGSFVKMKDKWFLKICLEIFWKIWVGRKEAICLALKMTWWAGWSPSFFTVRSEGKKMFNALYLRATFSPRFWKHFSKSSSVKNYKSFLKNEKWEHYWFFQESRMQILYFLIKYSNDYFSTIFFHKLVCLAGLYILYMLCKLWTINSFWLLNLVCFFPLGSAGWHWGYIFMWSDFMAWSHSCVSDALCQQRFLSSRIYSPCLDSIHKEKNPCLNLHFSALVWKSALVL